jgi:hypothetical protein
VIVRSRLSLDDIDAFLLAQLSLINKRRKCVLPIVRERQTLADSLARPRAKVGLEHSAREPGAPPASGIEKVPPREEMTLAPSSDSLCENSAKLSG